MKEIAPFILCLCWVFPASAKALSYQAVNVSEVGKLVRWVHKLSPSKFVKLKALPYIEFNPLRRLSDMDFTAIKKLKRKQLNQLDELPPEELNQFDGDDLQKRAIRRLLQNRKLNR